MTARTRSVSRAFGRVAFLAGALLTQAGCAEDLTGSAPANGLVYGAPIALGAGTARTYLIIEDGATTEVGVALSERAMTALPDAHSPGGIPSPDGHHAFEYTLQMPDGNRTPYRFVGLGWNPSGHEPNGIYDLPHFDFHFFLTSEAERDAIDPRDPQFAQKANNLPAADFIPQGYVHAAAPMGAPPAAAAVPRMGVHWMDPATPELHGQTFTRTFIYGTWNGKLTFAEPMITKAFIESKPNVKMPIATPKRYEVAGAYPSAYRIYWNAETSEYRIALSELSDRR